MAKKKRVEIVIPLPMPTWNRLLAMNRFQRMKLRHLVHAFVSLSITHGRDWPTRMVYRGRQQSTELLRLDYFQTIRPSSSRKSAISKLREDQRRRGL